MIILINEISFHMKAIKCCREIDTECNGQLHSFEHPYVYEGAATDRDTGIKVAITTGFYSSQNEIKVDLTIALIDHLQNLGIITGNTQYTHLLLLLTNNIVNQRTSLVWNVRTTYRQLLKNCIQYQLLS